MQVEVLGFVIVSVHALTLHDDAPVTHPQVLRAPSVVALHAAKVEKLYAVQAVATTQLVPLNAQVER